MSDRFWSKVNPDGEGGCWIWTGALNGGGYGQFTIDGKNWRVGAIPDGLTLDHPCRVKTCVNPAHLDPCTAKVNTLRSDGRSARNARKTHCAKRHPYDLVNTLFDRHGKRYCRTCKAEARKRFYEQNPGYDTARRTVLRSAGLPYRNLGDLKVVSRRMLRESKIAASDV